MVGRHQALAREEIIEALTAYTGVTTADGATPGNNTLIDSLLIGRNDFISGKTILIGAGVDASYEDKGAQSFDNLTGTITVSAGFSAQIKQGTPFRVLNVSPGSLVSARIDRQLFVLDFWSGTQEEVAVTTGPANQPLPNVTVAGLPAGATIVRAVAMFKFRMVENTNAAANKLNGAQHIQVRAAAPGTWRDAISLVDDLFGLAATTREGGDVLIGDHNIAVEVDGNDTYNVQWTNASADQNNLNFNDVQTGLRIWYSV